MCGASQKFRHVSQIVMIPPAPLLSEGMETNVVTLARTALPGCSLIGYCSCPIRNPHRPDGGTVKYVPPFELIKNSVDISAVKGELRVSVSYQDFINILKLFITGVEVDEEFYLRENPDIAKAVKEGTISSARKHFIDDGYLEGRPPFPLEVDEKWYLTHNPDVAEGVRKGTIESAQAHFAGSGYKEGRLPFGF
jgi:hypothetical protein